MDVHDWGRTPSHDVSQPTSLIHAHCTEVAYFSGSSALSPRGDDIAVYNVVDGVDIYGIKSSGGMRRKPKRTLKYPRLPRTKHALQATYIIDGRGIVCGTTTGDVCVWDTANSEVYQVLNHDKEEIIQAVAVRAPNVPSNPPFTTYCLQGVNRGEYSYVATATVDKGQATYVKVWRAKYGKSYIRSISPCSQASQFHWPMSPSPTKSSMRSAL